MHLILNSYGATLQKENGLFVISSNDGKQTIPPSQGKNHQQVGPHHRSIESIIDPPTTLFI